MPEQIQETQQVQPVQSVPVEPRKKSSLKIIVILFVVILLIASGVYAGMQLEKRKVRVWTEPPFTEITPQPTPIIDETANWNTYANNIYSIKVPLILEYDSRYPDLVDFMLFSKINNTNTTQRAGIGLEIGILKTPQGNTKCESDEACYQQALTSYSVGNNIGNLRELSTTIAGRTVKGLEIISKGTPEAPSQFVTYLYPMSVDGNYLNIQFTIGNASVNEAQSKLSLINQILSTFKFIE